MHEHTALTHSTTPIPVWSLLKSKCNGGSSASALAGEYEACQNKRQQGLQARLTVGMPGDRYEQQADQMADRAMRGSISKGAGGVSPIIPLVQRHGNGGAGGMPAPSIVHSVLSSSGQPLDSASRAWFEPRFRHDFSRVRIHTGEEAGRSAAALGARAYTVGRHVVFGSGQYAPALCSGRRLLGHELAHVMQQGEGSTMLQRDLIYGSGYPNPFKGDPAGETAAAKKNPSEWFPSSVDFKETASLSGGGNGIATLEGLLAEIGGKAVGSIKDLDLIGHANGDLFALGGTITRTSVSGSRGGTIGANQLATAQPEIDKVRDRFAAGGRITIYGCNSGASGTLLQAISTAFKVCARGFKDAITWCLGWKTKPVVINSRGRTLINPPAGTPCDQYNGSIYNLSSDMEDCSGTKPKPPDTDLPDRKPRVPEVPE